MRRVLSIVCFMLSLLAPPSQPAPDATLSAYVITLGPGDESWEKFGHIMIYFRDDRGLDQTYNWGMFDFESSHFLWHFIQGKLLYWMEDFPSGIVDLYIEQDRTVTLQRLNFSPPQTRKLHELCRTNALPQNKLYLYDYYLNNCSTKVRDTLDEALDGQLKTQAKKIASPYTFRSETSRLTADTLWLYVSLNFILGHPIDRPLTAWDEAFIPARLHDRLTQMRITEDGVARPMVAEERVIHASRRPPLRDEPPRWLTPFIGVGVLLGGLCALPGLCLRGWKSVLAATPALLWILLSTFAGGFCLFAWLLTDHAAVRPNENVLQFSPLAAVLLVAVPPALRRRQRAMKIAAVAAAVVAALSLLGLLGKVLPMMNQVNAELIGLALPANVGLAVGLWRLSRCTRPLPPPSSPVSRS